LPLRSLRKCGTEPRDRRTGDGAERFDDAPPGHESSCFAIARRAKACPPWADERCTGVPIVGLGYWKMDVGGAITYATFNFLKRDATLTGLSWNWQDLVGGHLLQLTNRADQSRTVAAIHMHENRLYILEGTVPKGYPESAIFQQAMGFVDKDGNGVRYQSVYSNLHPAPPRTRGGQGGGAGAGAAGNPAGGVR
jgi:hypothetical protein